MTDTEIGRMCNLLVDQAGLPEDAIAGAVGFWKANLLQLDYVKAQESIKAILFDSKKSSRKAGEWFAAVIKYCGGVQPTNGATRPAEPEGCKRCSFSGCIEVPHKDNWENGNWIGMYTMVVACECPAGQLRACQMMNIGQYEHLYPYWQQQYPRKQYEFQLANAEKKEEPKDQTSLKLHRGNIAWLKRQLADKWEAS